LPDLRGRAPIGSGQGPGLSNRLRGESIGVEEITLTNAELPIHAHTVPGSGATEIAGADQPFNNMQPSLGLHYLIATQGIYPSPDDSLDDETFLGEVTLFAGDFAPRGWALAEGQLLPINQNQALFSLLGTNYGGDGQVTFALPDLRGRTAIHAGTGPWQPGEFIGAEQHTLTIDELPSHQHSLPLPGDTDVDGDVDLNDLNNVRNHFGESGDPVVGDTSPFDGVVDLDDLNNVRNHFGQAAPSAQPAPEPTTFSLALVCLAIVITSSTQRPPSRPEPAPCRSCSSGRSPRCCR
jgi:microcystin-dependent protein